jgi:hypothetical protein
VGEWVSPQDDIMGSIHPQINPQLSDSHGRYFWEVSEGCWYIGVEAPGYEPAFSPLVGILGATTALTELNVNLSPGHTLFLPIVVQK